MEFHYGVPQASSKISDLISLYPKDEFASPTRSTIPLLDLLAHSPAVFELILDDLEFPANRTLYLEYKVQPKGGRGKASHTDAILIADRNSLAIEAKWTEPMYQQVDTWLAEGTNKTNRERVLDGWLKMIERYLSCKTLSAEHFSKTTYQMIHRAASAAFVASEANAGTLPSVAYFLFKEPDQANHHDKVLSMLQDFWRLLGHPSDLRFFVVQFDMIALAAYEPLRGLKKGADETSETICAALQDTMPLFNFENWNIKQVQC